MKRTVKITHMNGSCGESEVFSYEKLHQLIVAVSNELDYDVKVGIYKEADMVKAVEPYYTHTAQEAYYGDTTGELVGYRIYPDEGYMLHDKERDVYITDPATGEVLEDSKGYTSGILTVGRNYDFEVNPRGIYAVKAETEV